MWRKKVHGTHPVRCGEALALPLAFSLIQRKACSLDGRACEDIKAKSLRSELVITSLGVCPSTVQEIQDAVHIKAKVHYRGSSAPNRRKTRRIKRLLLGARRVRDAARAVPGAFVVGVHGSVDSFVFTGEVPGDLLSNLPDSRASSRLFLLHDPELDRLQRDLGVVAVEAGKDVFCHGGGQLAPLLRQHILRFACRPSTFVASSPNPRARFPTDSI